MKSIKVIKRLKMIKSKEMRYLSNFVHADFFNQDPAVRRLFDYLRKFHPTFTSRNLSDTTAHDAAFPDKAFDKKRLDGKCSDLCKLLDKYMIQVVLDKDKFKQQKLLAEAFSQRNKNELYFTQLHKNQKLNAQSPSVHEHQIPRKMHLSYQEYFHPSYDRMTEERALLFDRMVEETEVTYHLLRLRLAIEYKNREALLSKTRKHNFSDLKKLEIQEHHPIVFKLYLQVYHLLEEFSPKPFLKLKADFFKHENRLAKDVANTIAGNIMNFHTRHMNSATELTEKKALDFAKKIIKTKHLEENGVFPTSYFTNIVILASNLGETTWMTDFLAFGEEHLEEKNKEDALAIGQIYLYFAEEKYEQILDFQKYIFPKEVRVKLQFQVLFIRTVYELKKESNAYNLDDYLNAFKQTIRRNRKLDQTILTRNLNFSRFVKKLAKAKTRKKRASLIPEIENTIPLVAKTWLLAKAKE